MASSPGNKREVPGSHCLGNPTQSKIIKSYWLFLALSRCWELSTQDYHVWRESCVMMRSHPLGITGVAIPERAQERVQLIQKPLRPPADQARSLFLIANSACPSARLGKPYCSFQSAPATSCFSQRGSEAVGCLGVSWELCVTRCSLAGG